MPVLPCPEDCLRESTHEHFDGVFDYDVIGGLLAGICQKSIEAAPTAVENTSLGLALHGLTDLGRVLLKGHEPEQVWEPYSVERPSWDDYFLGIAKAVAARADCTRRKVGAVIVKDHRIVATGYNGGPSGGKSCLAGECPRGTFTTEEVPSFEQGNSDYSDCIAIHAEVNALLYADRSSIEDGAIYITCAPCGECQKVLANSGLARVVYPEGSVLL